MSIDPLDIAGRIPDSATKQTLDRWRDQLNPLVTQYNASSPGSGTVTSVSVTTANGVSGTVATATTTPAISLTLGAITPTTVAASGAISGSNLSGTNTGDNTEATALKSATTSVNVSSATAPTAGQVLKATSSTAATWQTLSSSGDVVGPASSVDSKVVLFDGTTGKLIKDSGLSLSGSNTGDQTSIVGLTGTMAQFDTAVSDGNIVYQSQALGTPSSGVATNLTGTAAGLTAGNVTTNANLTGPVTSVGNATTITDKAVTLAKMDDVVTSSVFYRKTAGTGVPEVNTLATLKTDLGLTGTNSGDQTISLTGGVTGSGTGSFAATVITNANLTGVITSAGNATSIASQTGTGTKFVVDNTPTLITPDIGAATGQSAFLTKTTQQLKLSYDASNSLSGTVGSAGTVAFTGAGASKAVSWTNYVMSVGKTWDEGVFQIKGGIPQLIIDSTNSGTQVNFELRKGNTQYWAFYVPAASGNFAFYNYTLGQDQLILNGATGAAVFTNTVAASNLSGTNTGDQASIVGITGTLAQFNTACTDADFARVDAANTFTGIQTFSTPIATGSVATMTATVGGGVPTPPNNTTTFLRGDGTFAAATATAPDLALTLIAPTIDETVTAGYSAYASDYYEIFDQKFLELGAEALMEVG